MGKSNRKNSAFSKAVVIVAAASTVSAHSWVVCTDYRGAKNPTTFDPSACKGWTRNAQQYVSGTFGQDVGLDTQTPGCKVTRSDSNYNAQYPMATWTPGQTACLIWPSKNHVASSKNINIPDGGVKIYGVPYGSADPTTNAGFTTLVADLGVSPYGSALTNPDAFPRPGFQNCPGFLSNSDKAVCSQCFTVPNLASGKYTMQWQWIFNPGTAAYVNCFDVQIGSGGSGGGSQQSPQVSPTSPRVSPTSSPRVSPSPQSSPRVSPASSPVSGGGGSGSGGLFSDGFENGLGNWVTSFPSCSGTGTVSIDSTKSYSGKNSLKVAGGGGFCNHAFAANTAIASARPSAFVRFYVNHNSAMFSNHHTFLTMKDANDGGQDLRLGGQNQKLSWNRQSDDATCPSQSPTGVGLSVALPANKWSCLEFEVDTANGYLHAWLDGSAVTALTVQNGVADVDAQWKSGKPNWKPSPQDLKLGWESYGNDSDTYWYDDVVISNSRIGCSGSIPAQSPASSPRVSPATSPASSPASGNGNGNCVAKYGQCGGSNFSGATCCQSGSTCNLVNQYYSQCL